MAQIRTIDELPLEVLTLLEEANAEISGRRVWPGSVLLACALCRTPPACSLLDRTVGLPMPWPMPVPSFSLSFSLSPTSSRLASGMLMQVLELGAGSALASMAAARLGARTVVATDGDRTSVDLALEVLPAAHRPAPLAATSSHALTSQ